MVTLALSGDGGVTQGYVRHVNTHPRSSFLKAKMEPLVITDRFPCWIRGHYFPDGIPYTVERRCDPRSSLTVKV